MTAQSAEQRARELLAAEYERDGEVTAPESVRKDELASLTGFQQRAIRAIVAALAASPAPSAGLEQRARELLANNYRPTEAECTEEAAVYFYRQGYEAALAAAPAADGWIAVSDRLPTGWEHVEVFPDPRDREHIYYAPIDGGTNGVKAGRWYLNDASGYDNEIRVTHWRTPAAPQAQGEGA